MKNKKRKQTGDTPTNEEKRIIDAFCNIIRYKRRFTKYWQDRINGITKDLYEMMEDNQIAKINKYIKEKNEEYNKKISKKKPKINCLFCIKGHCNSDYGNKMRCDGKHHPKKCPYKFGGSYAMMVSDHVNMRKK